MLLIATLSTCLDLGSKICIILIHDLAAAVVDDAKMPPAGTVGLMTSIPSLSHEVAGKRFSKGIYVSLSVSTGEYGSLLT